MRKGDFEKAAADLSHALTIEPGELPWLLLRGEVLWAKNDVSGALADFEAVLAHTPRHSTALLGRARARAVKGEADRALADLDAVLASNAHFTDAYRERASLRVRRGNIRGGAEDYLEVFQRSRSGRKEALADIERRAAELFIDRDDPVGCVELCTRVLSGLVPLLKGQSDLTKIATEAQASIQKETDPKVKARLLRDALLSIGAGWKESH